MNRYHVSFDLVCPFTGEHKVSASCLINADNPDLAVIFARDNVRKNDGIWGKAIDIRCFAL
jgi:hypothetical protein|tara:strand:- start:31 stop:213 length:183 start_codon:yes stop_codon:yes gene_type:complete